MANEEYTAHGERQNGSDQVVSHKHLYSTMFVRPGAPIGEHKFFQAQGSVSSHWQNLVMPVQGNFKYDVDAIRVDANIELEIGSNPLMNALQMKTFEESTYIQIDHVKIKDMYRFLLTDLLPWKWVPNVAADGSWNYSRQQKQTIWFPLQEVLQIGSQQAIEIMLSTPTGFVTQAYAAASTPILYGSALLADGSTPVNVGYYLKLVMNSIEGAKS